jgi:hypothetical protein
MKNQIAKSFATGLALVLGMACTRFASAQEHCSADYTDSFATTMDSIPASR